MRFLPLVWRNLLRRKVRTIFTVLSIFVAFLLFGVLMALRAAFSMGIELAGADRLIPEQYQASGHCPKDRRPGPGARGVKTSQTRTVGGYTGDQEARHMAVNPRVAADVPDYSCPSQKRPGGRS